jgi:hypothetical protein
MVTSMMLLTLRLRADGGAAAELTDGMRSFNV